MKKNLLLLHGALGSQKQFEFIKKALENKYHIHQLNFSGHGGKSIKSDFSMTLFMKDVEDYLQENNIQKVSIFGYSMGGYVALKLAAKGLTSIEEIWTLGTKFDWSEAATAKEIKNLNPEIIETKVPKFAFALQQEHHPENWKTVVNQTAKMMQHLSAHEQLKVEELQNISIPTRIGLGNTDKMVNKEESKWALDNLPYATFIELKNSPHPLTKVPLNEILRLLEGVK